MKIRQRKKNWSHHWFFSRWLGKSFDTFTRSDVERANAGTRRFKRSLRHINKFSKDVVANVYRVPKASRS